MSKQVLKMHQHFNAPVETIFAELSDHVKLGNILSADIKRVVDSQSDNANGLGSVRRLNLFPLPPFEETITAFDKNRLIEYRITKGSPLKNHVGTMRFSESNTGCSLDYTIEFEPRYPIPFLGSIIRQGLEKAITQGLGKFASRFN